MRLRFVRTISVVALSALTTAVVAVASPGTALANPDDKVTATEVANTLNNVDDKLIADPLPSTTDANSAAVTTQGDTVVDVAKDAEQGVTMSTKGEPDVTVELPNAEDAANAKRLADGTVVYAGSDGTANSVAAAREGTQMAVTIANKDAATRFDYTPNVEGGGKVQLTEGGGAVVLDADGNILKVVPPAWGKDAKDVDVPSHFETDGTTLTLVVDHTSADYAYPIVADPWWLGAIAAAVGWCAASAAQNIIWQGGKWAVQRGDWNWNQRLWDAADNCLAGLVFGAFGWAVPWYLKRWAINALKPHVYNVIRWTVLR
jgi:hypothetical protein